MNSKRIIGWLFAALGLALLQACSAIKLAYNNAPEFGYWWLDGYVDYQGEQGPRVRDELARLHQWHRVNELPKIADLLQKVQKLAATDIAPAQVCGVFNDTRERFNAVTTNVENAAAVLASSLKAEQLAHIQRKFDKGNDDWRREWLTLSAPERLQRRLKSNTERAEEFYGKLEERQVATLRATLENSGFDAQMSVTERLRRQQDLMQTLKAVSGKTSADDVLPALRAYVARANNSPNPAYRAYSDKLTQESCASFALLHNSTTPEQRRRAVGRLAAYERDARELSSQR